MPARVCPRCDCKTSAAECCGIIFAKRRKWRMSKILVRNVHIVARAQKGMTEEMYKLRLGAVGVESCKDFTREQYYTFMRELAKLPNAPRRRSGARA